MVWQCMICSGGVVKYGEGSGGQGLLICYGGGAPPVHGHTGNGGHHLGTAQGGGGTHNSTKRCSRALGSLSKSAALQRWKGETVLWCNTVEWWRGVGGESAVVSPGRHHIRTSGWRCLERVATTIIIIIIIISSSPSSPSTNKQLVFFGEGDH